MRLSPSLLLLLPAAYLAACATAPKGASTEAGKQSAAVGKATSRYLAAPPIIDGSASDWTDSLQYDANSHLQYQVLNDDRMVYLRLRANDASTQAKLVYLGTVVWLDSTGRNQQQLGVRFPLPIDLNSLKAAPDRPAGAMGPSAAERQAEHVARLRTAIAGDHEMELLNYRGSKQPVLTDSESKLGVQAAIGLDARNNLIYELAVPLRLVYRRVPALAAGQAATVGVWIAGQKPKLPPGSQSADNSVVGPQGGMGGYGGGYGGYGGGGYGGGGYRNRGGGGAPSFQTFSLRTSAQLAGK